MVVFIFLIFSIFDETSFKGILRELATCPLAYSAFVRTSITTAFSLLIAAIKAELSFALNKLLAGAELIFENGVKNPVIQNPSIENFVSTTFHHVSSTILWAKASYYPFNKIVSGFNIQIGPTIGHSFRSSEERASRIVDPTGQSSRSSTLVFNNGFTYGYRISTGIEFNITKKVLAGFRLDFSNNNEAEINTLIGLKAGLKM